jgi:lipopolysaccharide transport system ATP-binding protein
MIRVVNLSKSFKLYRSPADRLKEIIARRQYCTRFRALNHVSFEVGSGGVLGIIGPNGAGKSTLLKLLTGILLPDNGSIHVDGKATGLLELGTGFNHDLTGLQNIFLNGTLIGMSTGEIRDALDEIITFAELNGFITQPLRTYSSGMLIRLAFSIAIHSRPKAFVVDEALSVGDAHFQQKCMNRIKQFKAQGGSIIFVSHDMNAIKVLCDKVLLLDHGLVVELGDPEKVVNTYNFLLAKKSAQEEVRHWETPEIGKPYGNSKVEISRVQMLNEKGVESEVFISGERCIVDVRLKANEGVDNVTIGFLIRDRFGQDIFGTNTHHLKMPILLQSGEQCRPEFIIDELNLGPGKYTLTVAAHKEDTHLHECYQWVDAVKSFEVVTNKDFFFVGLSRLKPYVRIQRA